MTAPEFPCVCTTVRKATRALSRLYDDALAPAGITVAQWAVLRAIQRADGIPLSDLAAVMVMDRTSLYRSLTPLVKANLVTIAEGSKGRIKTAHLTPEALRLIDTAFQRWADVQSRVVESYGVERWEALLHAIDELTELGISLSR